jgi:hypothetical protein
VPAVVHHGTPAQRTPRHGDRVAVEHVVDDLVVVEVPDRVRAWTLASLDGENPIVGVAAVPLVERRLVDTRDGVARQHSPDVHDRGLPPGD